MIVDTSVIVALLREEADSDMFIDVMAAADSLLMSAGSRVELSVVTARGLKHPDRSKADAVLAIFNIRIAPVTESQTAIAETGYRRFGQAGSRPGKLNFGDCFAYALAIEAGEPLLFKGDDFAQTDVTPALR